MTRCRPSQCWPTRRSSPARAAASLTIRIEANEPFPNFGSTEQEKSHFGARRLRLRLARPATGAREKICTRPYADGYFHNYYDGRIYYTGNFRNADTPGQQAALLYF